MSLYLLDLVHATDLQKLRGTRVDFIILFVVMGYGYIINLQIITTPVLSTINISPFFKLSYLEAVRQEIPSRSCLILFFVSRSPLHRNFWPFKSLCGILQTCISPSSIIHCYSYVTPHVVLSDMWTAGILKQQGTCGVLLEAV